MRDIRHPEPHPTDRCRASSDRQVQWIRQPGPHPTDRCERFGAPGLIRPTGANDSAPRASSDRQVRTIRRPEPHPTDRCDGFGSPGLIRPTGARDSAPRASSDATQLQRLTRLEPMSLYHTNLCTCMLHSPQPPTSMIGTGSCLYFGSVGITEIHTALPTSS